MPDRSPLSIAAAAADLAEVRRLLGSGAAPDGDPHEPACPLWEACAAQAPAAARLAVAAALLDAGAWVRSDRPGETPLHAAARLGPLALVEALIAAGAVEWAPDRQGRTALDAARADEAPDREAIVELLDRPVIRDPTFRAAVAALHTGDAVELGRLLDRHPNLLHDRAVEPECYRQADRPQYFRDPKLLWFVADNPTLVDPMPAGMVDCAREIVRRGAAQADLDYTLGLVMTSAPAAAAGVARALMDLLLEAGAQAAPGTVEVTLGHGMTGPVEALLAAGRPMTAPIAAALGRVDELKTLLDVAPAGERQSAFGLAVINGRHAAARLCLDAGADVDAFLPVHSHSTPLHQAANHDDPEMLQLLAERGARDDIADTLWGGTALGWAQHERKPRATAFLERLAAQRRN